MKQLIFVGEYFLGRERVSLFVDPELSGGSMSLFSQDYRVSPKDTGHGRIIVGFGDSDRWKEVMEVLEHEVYEYAFTRLGVRFRPCDRDNVDSGAYHFSFNHIQFSEAIQMACWFLCPALPALSDVFRKHQRRRKRR